MRLFTIIATLLLAAAALIVVPHLETAQAADVAWDVSMKGVSKTMAGDKFKFGGDGGMTWDRDTGDVSFNLTTAQGPWTGTGTMVVADNGKTVYGLVNFLAGGEDAVAIFRGKMKKKGAKLVGSFQAASPSRLGPPPGGFVLTTGKITGTVKP